MNRRDWRIPLQFAALLLAGLLAGASVAIWRGYDPAGLSPGTFLEVHQNALRGLGTLLPAVGIACAVLVLGLAVLSRGRSTALWLYVAALVALIVGGLIAGSILRPVDVAVMQWTPASLPENWSELRAQWRLWHMRGTVLAVLAQMLLIAAVLADLRWRPVEPTRSEIHPGPRR